MEEDLRAIKSRAVQGTLQQFYTEVSARAAAAGYEIEIAGNTVTFFRIRKEGGFLGIGTRTVREPVLKITRKQKEIIVAEEPRDEAFVQELARMLKYH